MRVVRVDLRENSYDILIDNAILKNVGDIIRSLSLGEDAIVITNPLIAKYHGPVLADALKKSGCSVKFFEVPAGERSKSARQAFALIEKIAEYSVGKKIFIVAFGGGVIGDLVGYVAAAYRRGVPYIQVPTTFLAQIDSAIGGKVGVDLPMGKNLVGAFYQPKLVLSDVAVLSSLDKRQMRNGLAEAVKYGIVADKLLFHLLEKKYEAILSIDKRVLTDVVVACSQIKARIISQDEKETKNIRTIVNFGHTVGHAIEAANRFKDYHHGEAVALGMRVAGEISCKLGYWKKEEAERMGRLLTAIGLPERIRGVRAEAILKHMQHDKKFSGKRNKFVLATAIGSVRVVENIPLSVIRSAIKKFS